MNLKILKKSLNLLLPLKLNDFHEALVTVEPQEPQELLDPLAATKAATEVIVTVEPQDPQEVYESLAATKTSNEFHEVLCCVKIQMSWKILTKSGLLRTPEL